MLLVQELRMTGFGRGYVTDVPYTRGFFRELAPAWLDLTATINGIAPRPCGADLTWCELGCGQGVTAVVLAATHPRGHFVGIDLMPEHIGHARRLAAEAGVTNVQFRTADFVDPALDLPQFDYIVTHGVYSWVDATTQAALCHLIDRHLRPQGLAYVSYNAMPGWAADLPFQRLVRALGLELLGDSIARFTAAVDTLRQLRTAGAPSLEASPTAGELDKLLAELPLPYLAHEYMNAHWQPLFVTEVRAAMAQIGLAPAGSADLTKNFDAFVLRNVEREALARIENAELRELVRDFLLHRRFRCDVFSRDGDDLDADERHTGLLATRYALARPAEAIDYGVTTEAGKLSFDNPAARAIVTALADGPQTGAEIGGHSADRQDLVANLLTLCCAGAVRPVAAADSSVAAFNQVICQRAGGPEQIQYLALRCGTAVRIEPTVWPELHHKTDTAEPAVENWLRYLRRHADIG
jgi:SAM-dependent methyltransferase